MEHNHSKKSSVRINGINLNFQISGRGFPLVLLHTDHTYAKYFLNHQPVDQKFQIITLHIPGFYEPGGRKPVLTIDQFTDLLEKLFQKLNLGKVDLMGKCLGATLAFKFAAKYPQRVRKIVAVAIATKTLSPWVKKIGLSPLSELACHPTGAKFVRGLIDSASWRRVTNFLGGYYSFKEIFNPKNSLIRKHEANPQVFFSILADYLKTDFDSVLGKINCPVLFVNGEKDLTSTEKDLLKITRKKPNFSSAIIPNATHGLIYNNTEELHKIVTEFLLK